MAFDLQIVNGDLSILADGSLSTVSDSPKLVQDIGKMVVTPLGSNIFAPWYGCDLSDRVIGQGLSTQLLAQEIENSIENSLNIIRQLQSGQSSTQVLSLAEQLGPTKSITAYYDPNDSRKLNIAVIVYSKRLQQIQQVFTLNS